METPRPRRRRKPASRYHHGDLKTALVATAFDLLEREGPEGLTLRAVAARVGVTATAVYRHFADRRQLVGAVAEQGFQALQGEMLAGLQQGSSRAGLKQVALAYVRFARAHPAIYRVMFGAEVAHTDDLPSLRDTARGVLEFVGQGIAALQAAGLVRAGDPRLMAVTAWASLHGLAMLTLDGQTDGVAPTPEETAEALAQTLMFGMAPRASVP